MKYGLKENLTHQEAFDIAWRHAVIEKNPKCFTNRCQYRDGANGCFIGILLPDELAIEMDEWFSPISSFFAVSPGLIPFFLKEKVEKYLQSNLFWRKLQICHDTINGTDYHKEVEERLRALAIEENLTIPS